jgi:hypothetical protein
MPDSRIAELSREAALRQDGEVEFAPRRTAIGFELDGGRSPVAAVERGVLDEAAQRRVAPQLAPDAQAEIAGFGVVEARRNAAGAGVAMNEAQALRAHLPRLFDDFCHRRADEVARVKTVQVDLDQERTGGIRTHATNRSQLGFDQTPRIGIR